jgi:hypothetical protein
MQVFRSLFIISFACAATAPATLAGQTSRSTSSNQDWCADARDDRDRDREVFCEVRELTMAKPGVLDVTDNPNGSISITATNRKDIAIRARVVATDRTESDAAALGREVKVTAENGRVRADGPNTSGNRRSWWVSYRIEVPASQDLELGTSNGSVSISGVNGRIRAESSNGSLSLVDVGGDVIATTSNGSVHAALGGSTWSGAGLELRTSNGSVRVDVPEKYNARLIAGTSNGNISVDMPITVQGRISRQLETTLGSGGPTIRVSSSNGSVRIGRR